MTNFIRKKKMSNEVWEESVKGVTMKTKLQAKENKDSGGRNDEMRTKNKSIHL